MPSVSPRLLSRFRCTSPGSPPTSRMLTVDDRLENIRQALNLCKGVVDASGVPHLSGALGALDTVLQNVQLVRQLRLDFCDLAEKATALSVAVQNQMTSVTGVPSSPTFEQSVAEYTNTLQEIADMMKACAGLKWMTRWWRSKTLHQQIQDCHGRLDMCTRAFGITTTIDIHQVVNGITKTLKDSVRLTENMANTVEDQAVLSRARYAELTRLVLQKTSSCTEHRRQDVSSTISEFHNVHTISFADMRTTGIMMRTKDGSRISHGLLYRPRVEAILIRFYDPPCNTVKQFLRELAWWKESHDPHIPQVLGCSSLSEKTPFIVLTGVRFDNLRSYMDAHHSEGASNGLMAALRLMKGMASAVQYLSRTSLLTKELLRQSIEMQNLMLDASGELIVGRNMLGACPDVLPHRSFAPDDTWLTEEVSDAILTMLFDDAWDTSNWKFALGLGPQSYMRMVVKYIAFYEGYTMTQLVDGIEQLYNQLSARQNQGTVEFCDIRSAMLRSPIVNHNHIFRPSNVTDVELGDLGYFINAPGNSVRFQKLDNILDQLGVGIYHYPCTTISVSPNGQWHQDRNSDGSMRYMFQNPRFVYIRRLRRSDFINDHVKLWRFMIDHGALYRTTYCIPHGIPLQQLVLIVGIEEELRWASCDFPDHTQATPETLYFHEYAVPTSQQWGHWSSDADAAVADSIKVNGTTMRIGAFRRSQQNIAFVQLEEHDCRLMESEQ